MHTLIYGEPTKMSPQGLWKDICAEKKNYLQVLQGCNFLSSYDQFWMVLKYFELNFEQADLATDLRMVCKFKLHSSPIKKI